MADTFSTNILAVSDLVESGTNKVSGSGSASPEGVASDKLDVLDLPMSDEELLALRDEWEKAYAPYEGKVVIPTRKRNLKSYLGRNPNGVILDDEQPGPANLQFEAEETFLPAALARNPDPLVYCDNTPEGNKIADDVKTMLQFHADQLLLKRKLAVMVRQWSINHLGVLKSGWNEKISDVDIDNRKIENFVFDPNGYVDVYGDFTSWLGERVKVTASELIDLFPEEKAYIEETVSNEDGLKLGTQVIYTEWWTDEYCFTTYKEKVLEKHKNQYFKYPEAQTDPFGQPVLDEVGKPAMSKPHNHFAVPKKPYTFFSVFSLQDRPHDITGLIEQNIPNQHKITKRTNQIDDNVSQANNGLAFSENNFNQETAKQAADALTRGAGKILVPQGGPIGEAIVRIDAPSFPDSAFKDLQMAQEHLQTSWGIQGIVSQEQKPDTTARGMVLNQQRDTSRIGGGISDIIEQSVARSVYNWLVQLYVVFYDEAHFAAVVGSGKAVEYIQLSAQDLTRQLVVAVAPNSMRPKDETTQMNQASELFKAGAIGPKTLLEAMNFPNSDEAAADGVLFRIDPMTYFKLNFPEQFQALQQSMMEQQQQQQAQVQQQMAQEQQAGDQQLQMKQQAGQQQLQQGAQAHQQKVAQGDEMHQAKLSQFKEMASAKMAQAGKSLPK